MKTKWQIEFDFEQARKQANRLDDIADQLEHLAKKQIERYNQELPSYWRGKSASLFQKKQDEMKKNVLQSARELRQQAECIRRIARLLYEAEMAALEIARRRAYTDG
uniref:WXG100 family type VII secretion target n=1 Tax=uncultured Flavonifractor sp. TaxID=1193534 RepID=UPI002618AC2F|nr:WXG100 family type VII secretion target [uncultured Flavonifractor sp.]